MGPNAVAVKKLQVVDIVRSFCILAVVSLHLTSVSPRPANPWVQWFWLFFTKNGIYGVFLFFTVSGFLITRMIARTSTSLYQPAWRAFYARRVARLFPLLFLVVAAGACMNLFLKSPGPAFAGCIQHPTGYLGGFFWASILFFSMNWFIVFFHDADGFSMGFIWGVLWSLSIEEQFYIFYPLILGKTGTRKNLYWFLGSMVLLGILTRWGAVLLKPGDFYSDLFVSFGVFDAIAVGALLYVFSEQHKGFFLENQRLCAWLCGLGFLAVMAVYFGTHVSLPLDRVYAPLALCGALGVFLLGAIHLEFFESKKLWIFSLPGKVSYGAYLLHSFVLYFLWDFLSKTDINLGFLVYFSSTIGLAWVSYRFFEVPLNGWIRGLFGVAAGKS
jgi:peptidoglycan/LPS O-acetylase OafA/YrhL